MSWKALLLKIHGNCSSHVRGYANASVQPDGDVSRHVLPTAAEIAAMDHSNSRVDLLHGQQSGNLRRLSRPSRKSSFDAASLAKLSVSHTGSYSSAAVNVTRTLSLDGKDWEAVLQKSATHTLPPRRSQIGANDPDQDLPSQPHKHRSIFRLPMLNPLSEFSLAWHLLMLLVDLTYTAFIVPIGVGFDISDTAWTWCAVCDFTAGLLIAIDLFLGFHIGYVVTFNLRKRVVMDGKQVAKWYITRGSLAVDALSTIAWVTQVILVILTIGGENQRKVASQIQIMRLLRLVRLGRLFKAIILSSGGQGIMVLFSTKHKIDATVLYFLQLLYSVAVLVNLLGCLWYWTAEQQGFDNTWVTSFSPFINSYGTDGSLDSSQVREISKPYLYLTSVYWAVTTLTTVGYGDITPQTAAEEGVAIFVLVLGIIFFGVIVGSLTQLLQSASKNAHKAQVLRDKMDDVESWIRHRQLPASLRGRIREYYGQFWLKQADERDEAELLQELPHALRTEALWSMARKSMGKVALFNTLPEPLQFLLSSHSRPKKFPPGHDVNSQGGSAAKFWLIEYGKVVPVHNDIEGSSETLSFLLNAPCILQELDPRFQKNVQGYRTLTACGVWEWNVTALLGVCKHHPGLYEHLAREVLHWLDERLHNEPESWHPDLHNFVDEMHEKLDKRDRKLDEAARRRTTSVRSAGSNDPGAIVSYLSPFLQEGSAQDGSPRAQADRVPAKGPSSVKFQDELADEVMQAEALPAPPGDAGPRRIVPDAVAVSMPDAADTNSDFDFAASSEQETSVADGDSTELGVATQLQSIQEQLSELRQLVKRNLDNTS